MFSEICKIDCTTFSTDYFEILFFKKAQGTITLNHNEIKTHDNTLIFISPYQNENLDQHDLQVTTLIFQGAFLNDFFAEKLFTYCLIYFYQLHHPLKMSIDGTEIQKYCSLLTEIKADLFSSKTDSVHIIRSMLYYLLKRQTAGTPINFHLQ